MEYKFSDDEITQVILEISIDVLKNNFGYSEVQAIEMTKKYYQTSNLGDEHYHYEMPFRIAVLIHYTIGLKKDMYHFMDWLWENKMLEAPHDMWAYIHEQFDKKVYKTPDVDSNRRRVGRIEYRCQIGDAIGVSRPDQRLSG